MKTVDQLHREYASLVWIYKGLMKNLKPTKGKGRIYKEYNYVKKEFRKAKFAKKLIEDHLL